TFTLPAELRPLARSHPKKIYSLLMKAAADALQKLAKDPRYLGARIGALSVLHTWTRAMLFHPHVHMLVTAGGLSSDHSSWIEPKHRQFLVPVEALSVIFRAKICAGLKKAGLLGGVPPSLWKKDGVVHCQHAGGGAKVLDYVPRHLRIRLSLYSPPIRPRSHPRFLVPSVASVASSLSKRCLQIGAILHDASPLARPKLAPILALLIARSSTRVFPCRVPSPFRNLSTLILSDSFPVRCPSTPIQNFRPP